MILYFYIFTWSDAIFNKKLISLFFIFMSTTQSFAQANNYLRDTMLIKNQLKLVFKYKIDDVKFLTLKANGLTKYVYDIKNGVLPKTKKISHYRHKGVKAFRMGQFNKEYLRVVIESYQLQKGNFFIKGKVLTINLANSISSAIQASPQVYKEITRKSPTIIIDAGHGGRDVGAVYKGLVEKELTLILANKLKRQLNHRGYRVYMTRTTDVSRSLKQRTEYANAKRGDLFISIHANAAPKRKRPRVNYQGIEVFYLSLKNSKRVKNKRAVYRGRYIYSKRAYRKMVSRWKMYNSRQLTKHVKREMLKSVRRKYTVVDKGVKRKDFWVLLATNMPSILVETGYISHKNESKNLKSPHYQSLLVEGMANGVEAYFKNKKK